MPYPAQPAGDYDDDGQLVWTPNIHGNNGSAHSVSSDAREKQTVDRLREIVAEVTNNRIPAPTRKGPGFY